MALRSFVLVCAARRARGQLGVHNSMLVHVTRYTDVQAQVAEQIEEELAALRRRILFGDGASPSSARKELQALWEADFAVTTQKMGVRLGALRWEDVECFLAEAVKAITVRQVNGKADDALEYFQNPHGISVIAVGGNKLSRGLTLEGLSVSYYLRASRMYDTLMQMGRWFGYRPGYADLCRLYLTPELKNWFGRIALADVELRQEFDYMRLVGKTPLEYGLRVRTHPDGLMVTSRAKMRTSEVMSLSFAGTVSETVVFHRTGDAPSRNRSAVERCIESLGTAGIEGEGTATRVWRGVGVQEVLTLLESYRTHSAATKAQAEYLREYIVVQAAAGELVEWTVALVSSQAREARTTVIGGHRVRLVQRAEFGTSPQESAVAIKRLVNPRDETLDLSEAEMGRALALTRQRFEAGLSRSRRRDPPGTPDGVAIRSVRPEARGLLLIYPLLITSAWELQSGDVEAVKGFETIGLAFSFPKSSTAKTIDYQVNNVYWDQEVAGE
jgi:hypothetical protein